MKGFRNVIANNTFGILVGTAITVTAVSGTYMYNYQKGLDTYTTRDGLKVFKGHLSQRERFDRFAGSIPTSHKQQEADGSSATGEAASSSSQNKLVRKQKPTDMTLEEFIASFLPSGTLPPEDDGVADGKKGKSRRTSRERFAALTKLFERLDTNGDGVLDFAEYCALFCFLATDDEQFKTAFAMFDENNNNSLDAAEFQMLLRGLNPDPSAMVVSRGGVDVVGSPSSSSPQNKSSILYFFFGPKLDRNLSYKQFEGLVTDLRRAVREAEFEALDVHGSAELDATDLRRLMFDTSGATTTRTKEGDNNLNTPQSQRLSTPVVAQSVEEWEEARVEARRRHYREGDEHLTANVKTYIKFGEIIRCSEKISEAMSMYVAHKELVATRKGAEETKGDDGSVNNDAIGLTREEFLRAVHIGIGGRVKLTPREMELFFAIFDRDESGTIDLKEFGELCRLNQGYGAGFYRDFSQPQVSRLQQFQRCMMQQ